MCPSPNAANSARRLGGVLLLAALVACGAGRTVTIRGEVQHTVLDSCRFALDQVTGTQITFRDGDGEVVGTARAGQATKPREVANDPFNACLRAAPYSIEVPKEDFYVIEVFGSELDPVSFD